jgi:hypothetical protein
MFEKIGRYAETVATSAGQTRRGFLGRLGKGAAGVAGLVGGLLLFPREALACHCCGYGCPDGDFVTTGCPPGGGPCPRTIKHRGKICTIVQNDCGWTAATESQARTIRIEVWDGAVQDVSNLPPGWDYEIVDYDHLTSWRGNLDG